MHGTKPAAAALGFALQSMQKHSGIHTAAQGQKPSGGCTRWINS